MKKRMLAFLCIGTIWIGGCGHIQENPSEITIQRNGVIHIAEAKKPDYIMHEEGTDQEGLYWDGNSIDWSQYQLDESFQDALIQFTAKTTAKVMEENNENLCYSPMSLYYALSLAAIGSSGQTEQELLALLGVESREKLKDQCNKLYHILYTDTDESVIQLANSIWKAYDEGEEAIALKETYIKDASEQLFSSIYEVKRTEAEDQIAQWISKQTNGFLNPTSSKKPVEWDLALINTIYYRDQWVNRFPEQLTEEGEFTKTDQSKVKCSFMNTENQANVKETDQFLQASLQLKDSEMFFVLPKPGVDAHQLIKSEEILNQILTEDGETRCQVIWRVPKFNYETSIENLDQVVKELGVVSAFERSDGFENMTDTKMYIDKIIQKSKIMIDEKGVEAAAYTQIMMNEAAALTEQTVSMNLDHPFIYGIQKDGNCLFIGICEQPQKDSDSISDNKTEQNDNPASDSVLTSYIPKVETWKEVYVNDAEGHHVKVTNEYMQRLWDILQSIGTSEVRYIDVSELPQNYQYCVLIQAEDGTVKDICFNETEGVLGHGSEDRGKFTISNNINPLVKEFMKNIMDVNGTIEAPTI